MSAALRLRFGVVSAGLVCLLLSYAVAQQDTATQPGRRDANASGQSDRATTQQTDSATSDIRGRSATDSSQNRTNYRAAQATAGSQSPVDHFFAGCLLAKNKAEVELSQIALQKAENPEVKQFAQKMVQDHQKMIQQLQPLAMQGGANRSTSSTLGSSSESRGRSATTEGRTTDTTALPGSSGASQTIAPSGASATIPSADATAGTTTSETATATAGMGNSPVHQLMQIDRQINERALQMARDDLQQKSGAEFDKCYVGNAITAHVHALAALEVIGRQTQGTLAQVARQAQPDVQQHLDHAKQLMKQLESQSGATGTQAQRESKRTE
jgi:predicted outer membrane protein